MSSSAHTFALFFSAAPKSLGAADFFIISDKEVVHRIKTVLRLQDNERCVIFNEQYHYSGYINTIDKHSIRFTIEKGNINQIYAPVITAYIPLLKKNNLEEAVYNATEVGIQNIQLYASEKCHVSGWNTNVQERLHKQMVAAAELSKNYRGTSIQKPVPLSTIAEQPASTVHILFDSDGTPVKDFIATGLKTDTRAIACLIGPESGLTTRERDLLTIHGWHTICLTPTIIRASQVITLAGGLLRSWYTHQLT